MSSHVQSIMGSIQRELAGPAEGQYQTILTDTLENNTPVNCLATDLFSFVLTEPTTELCLDMALTGNLGSGSLRVQLFSLDQCGDVGDFGLIEGMSSNDECVENLAAGDYRILVTGAGVPVPVAYTLTISASADTVDNPFQVLDEECLLNVACN